MSLLRPRASRTPEVRAITSVPFGSIADDPLSVRVGRDAESVMGSLSHVFAAHRFIIDQFVSIPFHAYRVLPDGSRRREANQPALLQDPHPQGFPPYVWFTQLMASLLGEGNAYGIVTSSDSRGQATKVLWLDPQHCDVQATADGVTYYYGGARIADPVVHVPWIVQPGRLKALSPIGAFRALWETGAAGQELARTWNAGGGVPLAHMKSEGALDDVAAAQAKERARATIRARDLLVTGSDWSFTPLSLNPADLQFVETLKMTATQTANVYGIPPEKIGGERGSSLTYSTVLMDQLDTQVQTLGPWCVRAQQVLSSLLIRPLIVRANLDAVLRADPMTRAQVMSAELTSGMTTQDEGRGTLDRPPLTDAERAAWLEAYRKAPTTPTAAPAGGTP